MALDVRSAASRRRFYLERGLRKGTHGSGSDLRRLMSQRPPSLAIVPSKVFDDIPVMLIGAHAAAAYAPARQTNDIDFIVEPSRFAEAEAKLAARGWQKTTNLAFAGTSLGLYGSA